MRITESKLRSIIRSVIRESEMYYGPDGQPLSDDEWHRHYGETRPIQTKKDDVAPDGRNDDIHDSPWTPGQRRAIEQGLYNQQGEPIDLDKDEW